MSIVNIPARTEKSPFASMKGHHVAVRAFWQLHAQRPAEWRAEIVYQSKERIE